MIISTIFQRLKKEQAELDSFIYHQRSIQFEWFSFWNAKRLKLALLTEIAEFANELRTFKIWSQKELVNLDKAKEELIDCLCFFLGLVNLYNISSLDIINSVFSFPETEFNDLLLDFFTKTYHLVIIESSTLYPYQIKLTPSQLTTYQEWWKVFQHCCQKLKIESETELFSIYLNKKKVNLERKK